MVSGWKAYQLIILQNYELILIDLVFLIMQYIILFCPSIDFVQITCNQTIYPPIKDHQRVTILPQKDANHKVFVVVLHLFGFILCLPMVIWCLF